MIAENDPQSEFEGLRRRILADWRYQMDAIPGGRISATHLLALWSRYKFVVLACDERVYRQIGPLLADLSSEVQKRAERVLELVMAALATPASRQNHVNALQHVAGFLSKTLDATEKQTWLAALAEYRNGRAEFSSTAGLLQHYLQRYGNDYVRAQHYPRCFLLPSSK